MTMTKREYAEAIVENLNARSEEHQYKVTEVEKANGVIKTGILLTDNKIAPTVYVDGFYNEGKEVSEVATQIETIISINRVDSLNTKDFSDYEKMKGNLRARLYNKRTKAEVFRSAKARGYDDLIIVPYATVPEMPGNAAFKITKAILEEWGVTQSEVIDTALANSKKEILITDMKSMFIDMGMPEEQAEMMAGDAPMTIITNTTKTNGAISLMFTRNYLRRKFPNGYVVLPSSIHEVLVVPREMAEENYMTSMVQEVNSTEVNPEEQLSDKAYVFA